MAEVTEDMQHPKRPPRRSGCYARHLKRLQDCFLAFLALLLSSPLLLFLALLVRMRLGSPVLFRQERPGRDERIFRLVKFRTMTDAKDGQGRLLPDADRLTGFGKWLRGTSLDELPELWNILKGDMSFVGPRPLAKIYLPYYTGEERRRHYVRPGLTGLAQVSGRNALSWEEKFAYDVWYVDHLTFAGDCGILLRTVRKVFLREGIGQAEEAPESLHILRQKRIESAGRDGDIHEHHREKGISASDGSGRHGAVPGDGERSGNGAAAGRMELSDSALRAGGVVSKGSDG
jgi:lipopolysaccharide/colanic/teichoic acid biosynthesis glycosyltransferase